MRRISEGPLYERARAALDEHIQHYFVERDIKATLAQYYENAIGVGTGRGESPMDPAGLREVIRNDLEEVSEMVDALIYDRTQSLTESYRKLEQMVIRDRLTGMFNRVRIDHVLKQELVRANRYDRYFSVIFLDIDHFKDVNDTYGHLTGDEILKVLASHIQNNIRETDTAARWGGEEFVIVLPETGLAGAEQVAEKLRRAFESLPCRVNSHSITLTLSLGVGGWRAGDNIDSILQRADKALYEAKANGRNCTVLATEE